MTKARRRSNVSSQTASLAGFKSKFEVVEDEPVFIDRLHGARPSDLAQLASASDAGSADSENIDGAPLEKSFTASSTGSSAESDDTPAGRMHKSVPGA